MKPEKLSRDYLLGFVQCYHELMKRSGVNRKGKSIPSMSKDELITEFEGIKYMFTFLGGRK